MTVCMRLLGCFFLLLLLAGFDLEPQAKTTGTVPAKEAPAKPASHKVERGPFKIDITLKAILEAEEMTEIALYPEVWTPDAGYKLTVQSAVEHGSVVHKGDTLISLDLEKIDHAIHDLDKESRLAELALKLAEEELPVLEKSTPLDLAAAERTKKLADEDLKLFLDLERDLTAKTVQQSAKNAANRLEYAKEELRQLEKMYRANDLREETEEIILKRQRNEVESAAFGLKIAEHRREETLKVELPRKEQTLKESTLKQSLTLEKARATLPLTLNQKRLSLDKMKYDRDRSAERLSKLHHDRAAMTVKAPVDGIVYYGKCQRGQWISAGMIAGRLQRGGLLSPGEVVLTLVKPRPFFVRAVVEEKDLQAIRPGMPGKAVAAGYPDLNLAARVKEVTAIPVTPGSFEAKFTVDVAKDAEALMTGMACTVKLVAYAKADALTVPATAVFSEELDEDKHFVYLLGKDGKHSKRTVTIGKKSGSKTEIVQGLQPGDEILLEKPADAAKKGGTP